MADKSKTILDEEKLSEAVQKYPILCQDEKNVAWSRVAKHIGLKDGKQVQTSFTNLRTKYGRKKAAFKSENTSGKGTKELKKLKDDYERYIFMVHCT